MKPVNAFEITTAIQCNLSLWGVDDDGQLEWCGHEKNMREWKLLIEKYEDAYGYCL